MICVSSSDASVYCLISTDPNTELIKLLYNDILSKQSQSAVDTVIVLKLLLKKKMNVFI